MSTEQNAVESPETLQAEADDSWRQEMQARLQEYRERRVRNGWRTPEPAGTGGVRVIPFRRPRPSRSMEWAIADAEQESRPSLEEPPSAPPVAVKRRESAVRPAPAPERPLAPAPPVAVAPDPAVETASASLAAAPVIAEPAPRRNFTRETGTELAEPAIRPRSQRAPEPPPALHSEQTRIRIELDDSWEKQNEAQLELPVPVAPRSLRWNAVMNDALFVLGGSGLFGISAWLEMRMPGLPPGQEFAHLVPALVGVPVALFAVYLLLSFTISDGTPGMKQAGLEVRDFTGAKAGRKALRRRGWASALSLAACGLGFFWALFDADGLTLHDHISSTFLTVRRRPRAKKPVQKQPPAPRVQ